MKGTNNMTEEEIRIIHDEEYGEEMANCENCERFHNFDEYVCPGCIHEAACVEQKKYLGIY